MEYKLSVALYGHSADVRSLAVTHDGCIVSASRDRTTKIWKPNELNAVYSDVQTLQGHKNFVSCVCTLPPAEDHPNGLIVTGSNDKNIHIYSPDSPDPLFKLEGHTNAVCKLSPGVGKGTVLSSSWDTTVRVWSLKDRTTILTISGHQAAVWSAIQLSSGIILSGGADKTIRVYLRDGSFKTSLLGHKDCVRDLAPVTDTIFLSCSNDATVKQWNAATGECLDTLYGHPNFIYCLSIFGDIIASSGEDRNVHVWHKSQSQSLMLPAQSVWSVVCLPNGDIATGSSDGMVRVFSTDPSRQADAETQAVYNEEVSSAGISSQKEIGGVKIADLPGPEVLVQPGTKDGQNKMVNENGKVVLYSWSDTSYEWTKVGDVMGSNDGKDEEATTPGKVKFNGKEYDHVFDVDIEDGKPALKLPFNKGDDPWHAAQNFIHQNNLNQQFLEQVANFIISNAKGSEVVPQTSNNFEFIDPFTGGARYIPGGSTAGPANSVMADPFTGGSRYVPTGAAPIVPEIKSKFFPQKSCLSFEAGNLSLINDKLIQFNDKLTNDALKLDPVSLSKLIALADGSAANAVVTPESISSLQIAYQWPEELVFPVLDITRLAVKSPSANSVLCSGETGEFLACILNQKLNSSMDANQMLSLKVFSNMLQHLPGKELVFKNKDFILSSVSNLSLSTASKPLQVAAVTILLNLGIVFEQSKSRDDLANTLSLLSAVLPQLSDPEAIFRALVAVGTIVAVSPTLKLVTPTIKATVSQINETSRSDNKPAVEKVCACSQDLLNAL